jgi:hypothetical protein
VVAIVGMRTRSQNAAESRRADEAKATADARRAAEAKP